MNKNEAEAVIKDTIEYLSRNISRDLKNLFKEYEKE